MRLLIVIVNFRTASLVIDCLRSLDQPMRDLPGSKVVVTDNASGNNSVQQISRAVADNGWGDWAQIIQLDSNGGFARGNNEAIEPALASNDPPQFVLLLNPDTVVHPGAVSSLLAFMESHPRVGIAGSRLEHPDGSPQRSAFRFHSVLSELESGFRLGLLSRMLARYVVAPPVSEEACQTDWVAGASMMIRKEVFDAIGLLDDKYFMYFEEVDFCLRARRAGWICWYVPQSRVVHLVGQSSGVTDAKQSRKRRPAYWFESRRRYFRKNLGYFRTLLADLAWSSGFAAYRLRRLIWRKPDADPQYFLRDFVRYNLIGPLKSP